MRFITFGSLALAIFLIIYILLKILFRGRMLVKMRLGDIEAISEEEETLLDITALTGERIQDEPIFDWPLVGPYLKRTSIQLREAHLMIKPTEYLLISVFVSMGLFAGLRLATANIILAIFGAVAGFMAPKLFIVKAQNKRKQALNNQLPEFLNILSNALRAGLSFNQAIATASEEMSDPIRWEFKKVLRDTSLGRPLDEALIEMVVRTGDEDMEMFVSAVIIQRQVGGNLSEVLDMIANTIRERVKLKGEIRTMTAQNKMSAMIIGMLPLAIALILSVLNPEYLEPLYTNPLGIALVVVALVMMGIGALLLKKVTTLEV